MGQFDEALSRADALRARGEDTAELRLMIGAIQFALADFGEARRSFVLADAARTYLVADTESDSDNLFLKTDLAQIDWLRLSTLRSDKSLPKSLIIDPIERVLAGTWDPERYVQERMAGARQVFDAAILSIASSPGRDAMLDGLVSDHVPEYRCTGYFIAAEAALARGDRAEAQKFLRQATGREVQLLEFHIARAELQRLS